MRVWVLAETLLSEHRVNYDQPPEIARPKRYNLGTFLNLFSGAYVGVQNRRLIGGCLGSGIARTLAGNAGGT
jgi:hypothetical protein